MGFFVLLTGLLLLIAAAGLGAISHSGPALDDFVAFSIGGGLLLAGGVAAIAHRWGILIAWIGCGVALVAGLLRFFYLQTCLDTLPNAFLGAIALIGYAGVCAGIFWALTLDLRRALSDDAL